MEGLNDRETYKAELLEEIRETKLYLEELWEAYKQIIMSEVSGEPQEILQDLS